MSGDTYTCRADEGKRRITRSRGAAVTVEGVAPFAAISLVESRTCASETHLVMFIAALQLWRLATTNIGKLGSTKWA
jgi:hypothetical protein